MYQLAQQQQQQQQPLQQTQQHLQQQQQQQRLYQQQQATSVANAQQIVSWEQPQMMTQSALCTGDKDAHNDIVLIKVNPF